MRRRYCQGTIGPLPSLRSWAKERLASYKVPADIKVVDELPRNALGKAVKPQVAKMFHPNTKV